ncbi:MAG: hypothetical protein AAF740_12175, partial [Bacteroidota bacterium]
KESQKMRTQITSRFLPFFLLILLVGTLPSSEAYSQHRKEKGFLFFKPRRTPGKGFLWGLFSKNPCPDIRKSKAGNTPRLSKRERRELARKNEVLVKSLPEKVSTPTEPIVKVNPDTASSSSSPPPPDILTATAGAEVDLSTLTEPSKTTERPLDTKKATVSTSAEEEKVVEMTVKSSLWYASESAVAESVDDFTFLADDAPFSDADYALMEKLAQNYRFGFTIHLTERLEAAAIDTGSVETYRRMNRIKAMLIASYKVSPDAIYLSAKPAEGSPSRIIVDLR